MLDKLFALRQNQTTALRELWAGVATFLASMYIIVVNPALLSQAGMPFAATLTATILVSFLASVLMGIYANNPLLIAPGMGLNAFFAFTAVNTLGLSWQVALGAVFWSGILFLLLSLFNIRELVARAIPLSIRVGVATGIGLFISLLGLSNGGLVVAGKGTLLSVGSLSTPSTLLFLVGLMITVGLVVRGVQASIALGIVFTTLLGWVVGGLQLIEAPLVEWKGWWAAPDFSLLFQLDLVNSLRWSVGPVLFAFFFTDLFDSLSTFVGVAEASGLKDENGEPRQLRRSLLTDALATVFSGLFGSSPATTFIESGVGIAQGGRTGLTAVVAGSLFLPFLFLSPLLAMIPAFAVAPALVMVGVYMLKPLERLDWSHYEEAIPAFLAMVLIPFTFSISQGIIWGFLSWTFIQLVKGQGRSVAPVVYAVDFLCIFYLISHA
jgi:AGZA family xanthine/uracil permease-like MFS transporter